LLFGDSAVAQLTILSKGNSTLQWQKVQLSQIAAQLSDKAVAGDLRTELEAQQRWLTAYKPGELNDAGLAVESKPTAPLIEPVLDPGKKATPLRRKLLGPDAKPTSGDTESLKKALQDAPDDLGLRQLQLHWLDQPQYREDYAKEIAEAAVRFGALLQDAKMEPEAQKIAMAFTLYRQARALGYRQDPDVMAKKPLSEEERKQVEAELVGAYNQLVQLAGTGRPEFALLDIRMLRRDQWYGRALDLLERNAKSIEPRWYLEKRRDLLRDLGWKPAADEAHKLFVAAFPTEATP
jgi:hypothetical protein